MRLTNIAFSLLSLAPLINAMAVSQHDDTKLSLDVTIRTKDNEPRQFYFYTSKRQELIQRPGWNVTTDTLETTKEGLNADIKSYVERRGQGEYFIYPSEFGGFTAAKTGTCLGGMMFELEKDEQGKIGFVKTDYADNDCQGRKRVFRYNHDKLKEVQLDVAFAGSQ